VIVVCQPLFPASQGHGLQGDGAAVPATRSLDFAPQKKVTLADRLCRGLQAFSCLLLWRPAAQPAPFQKTELASSITVSDKAKFFFGDDFDN
jgi:hypothetical protein